jgi:hypothetical protein
MLWLDELLEVRARLTRLCLLLLDREHSRARLSSPARPRSLWAFGEPQQSIRLIAICFSLQILVAGGADGYDNSNRSAMSLNKKRPLAALYFANRII